MKFMVRGVVAAVFLLFFGGCANHGPGQFGRSDSDMAGFQAAQSCCLSIKDLSFEPLILGKDYDADMDLETSAFTFPTGKSFYHAYKIQPDSPPFSIDVVSRPRFGRNFYPTVLFLNGDFQTTRHIGPPTIAWGTDWGGIVKISGKIPVNPRASGERYIIVLTTSQLMNSLHREHGDDTMLSGGKGFFVLPGASVNWLFGPTGAVYFSANKL